MAAKKPWDIATDGPRNNGNRPDPPVSKGLGYLTTVDGTSMEVLTRTTPKIVRAIDAGTVYVARYGSGYIQKRIEQIERLAVSNGGLGRDELIRMIEAGGRLPDSYYLTGQPIRQAVDYRLEDDR